MTTSTTATMVLKATLRRELKSRLASIPAVSRAYQGSVLQQLVLNTPYYKAAKRVGVYINMPSEVPTDVILQDLLTDPEKMCFVPLVQGATMSMLRLYNEGDLASLEADNKFHIREPHPYYKDGGDAILRDDAATTGGLDLIIVPGLGFDKNGNRLGRGKGYYDKLLNGYESMKQTGCKFPTTVSILFREQLVDEIPTEEYDHPVDHVIVT